jgi:hypothetical protein
MSEKNAKEHTGEPSGANREEGLGLEATSPEKLNEYLEITDEYIEKPDEIDPSVHVLHPNRNTSKGEDDHNTGETRVKQ